MDDEPKGSVVPEKPPVMGALFDQEKRIDDLKNSITILTKALSSILTSRAEKTSDSDKDPEAPSSIKISSVIKRHSRKIMKQNARVKDIVERLEV